MGSNRVFSPVPDGAGFTKLCVCLANLDISFRELRNTY